MSYFFPTRRRRRALKEVRCQICKKKFPVINHLHLRSHKISVGDYMERFPKAAMQSEAAIQKRHKNGGGGVAIRKFNQKYNGSAAHRKNARKGALINWLNGGCSKGGIATAKKGIAIHFWKNSKHEKLIKPFLTKLGFKTQVEIHGQYRIAICDFLHPEKKLIVEIDGKGHGSKKDKRREKRLNARGYKVIRFTNENVQNNLEAVQTAISREMRA